MEKDWSIWRLKANRPFAPSDYVFLADAGERVCKAAWEDKWPEAFAHRTVFGAIPHPSDVFDSFGDIVREDLAANHGAQVLAILDRAEPQGYRGNPSMAQWEMAYSRFSFDFEHGDEMRRFRGEAAAYLHKLFADGLLATAIREQGTGKMHFLNPDAWNCESEVALERLRTCKIDLANPFNSAKPPPVTMPCWLFVSADSLEQMLAALHTVKAGRGSSEAPAAEEAVQSTAKALQECREWLARQFSDDSTATTTKTEFRAKAVDEVFKGRLSKRGFNNVWDDLIKLFPERGKSGPKGVRH